ncbi:MAG: flagellar hook-associated protein FlgK [Pseudomonadota bacterium]|nr:flagellar hook-associated protein FlgK [Pseudomonadota bacterium]
MASDLFSIGLSGLRASRAALDLTAQNISNAGTEGYIRRSLRVSEVGSAGTWLAPTDLTLSGVRIDGVTRNADLFRQAEVRRTGSDSARAAEELSGYENIEAALEQSGLFPAMTAFESALQRLESNPVDPALRAGALEDARTVARSFNLASGSLDTLGEGLRFAASAGTQDVNTYAAELARVNLQLTRASAGSSDQTMLLDRRDTLLQQIATQVGISTSYGPDQSVTVRIGGSSGPVLVTAGTTQPFAMTTAADGTIGFTLAGSAVALSSGKLAGLAQGLVGVRDSKAELDGIANSLVTAANAAQAGGVALDGSAGQPLFAGSGAGGITLALASGAGLATAPAGAGAGSRDPANLAALRNALDGAGVTDRIDSLMFGAASATSARRTTADALDSIAGAARLALAEQAGVSLDDEAANLVRFQQAFQASGRVIQVASDLFDTLLAIR